MIPVPITNMALEDSSRMASSLREAEKPPSTSQGPCSAQGKVLLKGWKAWRLA